METPVRLRLAYSGLFWLILAYSGLFWPILAYSGLFWLKVITESRENSGLMGKK